MSIGEFARQSGLSISALRFYDARGVFRPAAVDPASGYRLYETSQVADGVRLAELRRLGLPLAMVTEFLAASDDVRRQLLEEHVVSLTRRIEDAVAIAKRILEYHPPKESKMELSVRTQELRRAAEQVLPAAGKDPERPLLMSVLVESKSGSLRLVATDSYRLAIRDVPLTDAPEDFRAVIASASLERLLDLLVDDGVAQLRVDGNQLVLTTAAREDRAHTMPFDYPDYEAILDAAPTTSSLVVDRTRLADALAASAGTEAVWCRFASGRLAITTADGEVEIPADYDGAELEFGVNPSYAEYAVRSAVGADIVIEASGPLSPVTFRSADDGTFVCWVMPVKL